MLSQRVMESITNHNSTCTIHRTVPGTHCYYGTIQSARYSTPDKTLKQINEPTPRPPRPPCPPASRSNLVEAIIPEELEDVTLPCLRPLPPAAVRSLVQRAELEEKPQEPPVVVLTEWCCWFFFNKKAKPCFIHRNYTPREKEGVPPGDD